MGDEVEETTTSAGRCSADQRGELFSTVDVAEQLECLLSGPAAPLAGPIAASLQSNAVGLGE